MLILARERSIRALRIAKLFALTVLYKAPQGAETPMSWIRSKVLGLLSFELLFSSAPKGLRGHRRPDKVLGFGVQGFGLRAAAPRFRI